jgi:hypothetical protein
MQLKLPQADWYFNTDTQVYLGIKKTLYSFTPLQVKTLPAPRVTTAEALYYADQVGIGSLALGI